MMTSPHYKFIFTDIRFPNEIKLLTEIFNCVTIGIHCDEDLRKERIEIRDNMEFKSTWLQRLLKIDEWSKMNNHSSERQLKEFECDYNIDNSYSEKETKEQLDKIMEDML